ncbi:acyl-CoA dehydrogenase family protein [Rhodobacteraceae bacterium NNCM2]|nr:acyl-CoA dehydrogenase family protein [Coraliihabitans acroporae]
MDFSLSDERRMLKETAERYLLDTYPIETRHKVAAMDGGYDPEQWKQMADLGLVGALLSPEAGGYGGTGEDIALVFEVLGRSLVVEPFLATAILGAAPLVLSGSEAQRKMLDAVIAGDLTLAFAHGEPEGRYAPTHVATRAVDQGGWKLTGAKAVVLNGETADHLVVSARVSGEVAEAEGLGLFLVDKGAAGLSLRGYGTVEGGHACEITLQDTPAAPIGEPGKAAPVIEATIARALLALSAEALGIMEVCKDMTLDYLKTRAQFGRPIGKFQVIQHRMVDMVLEIEQARSAVMLATASLDGPRIERERTLSAAKNLIGRVGRLVAEESIQLHGGIAMTWDYALPHYAKRLVMIDHLFGDTDHHLARFQQLAREVA